MLTVIVCLLGSAKSSTRKPFASRYSVMPSTDVTRSTPLGSAGFCPNAVIDGMAISANANSRQLIFIVVFMTFLLEAKELKVSGARAHFIASGQACQTARGLPSIHGLFWLPRAVERDRRRRESDRS